MKFNLFYEYKLLFSRVYKLCHMFCGKCVFVHKKNQELYINEKKSLLNIIKLYNKVYNSNFYI